LISSRLAHIPWGHTVAELVAFPFASETALQLATTSLSPGMSREEEATGRLWRAVEREMLASAPTLSLDELLALRDFFWFENGEGERQEALPLDRYLGRVARNLLRPTGSSAVPDLGWQDLRYTGRDPAVYLRSLWRWMSFALPPDMLLAPLGDAWHGPERVDTLSPPLAQRLQDDGYAESHLHLGAAFDFPVLWRCTLLALASSDADGFLGETAFKSPGAALDEGRCFTAWLLRAATMRYLLGAFLSREPGTAGFVPFLQGVMSRARDSLGPTGEAALRFVIDDVRSGSLASEGPDLATVRQLYAALTGIRGFKLPEAPELSWQADALAPLMTACSARREPDMWLVRRGLDHLGSFRTKDRLFEALFWQVLRVRCLFYRHVVQRPMTPGLPWFIRFFGRLRPARGPLKDGARLRTALRLDGAGYGLRSLEVRIGPPEDLLGFCRQAHGALQEHAAPQEAGPRDTSDDDGRPRRHTSGPAPLEVGAVIHFQRNRNPAHASDGHPTALGHRSHADPSSRDNLASGYRFASFYKQRRSEAQALGRGLWTFPLCLEWIRGLDLCSDEAGVPLWVMQPLLRYAREAGDQASLRLRRELSLDVPALRTSVHAGEDFVHLLTGLRRLDEAIDWLELRPGDRIGHGLSLGVEPGAWARRSGRIAIPAEDRLFDLAWEWDWRSRHGGTASGHRHMLIERELTEHSNRIFGKPLTPHTVGTLVGYLHDEAQLRAAGFPDGPGPRAKSDNLDLLVRFLTDPGAFERGRQLVWLDPVQEVEALEELQRALRRKVGERELVVEVNPSSNLLIGHLADLRHHPLWRLRPLSPEDDTPPISVTIGSDDPITFATHLRQEYQLLYDAMVLGGCSSEQAEQWLEGARRTSLAARFTIPWRSGQLPDAFPVTDLIPIPLPP